MEKIFTEQALESIEDKIKQHHQLYPNIPVNAQYWESIASQSLNVVGWVVNNHNPNEDFNEFCNEAGTDSVICEIFS